MRYRFTKYDITEVDNHDGSFTLSITIDGQYKHMNYMGYSRKVAYQRFQNDFGTYPDDYRPAGVLALSNFGGIAVMEIKHEIDDYVIVCDNYGDGYKNITKNRVRYDRKGNSYFIRNKQRYYLSEFMKPSMSKQKTTYYTDRIYGGCFTYDEMVEDAKKNYDYGDPTNCLTYQKDWWKENYKEVN